MNLVRETKTGFVFLLGNEEKELFLQILDRYPRVPESHLPVSKTPELPKSEEMRRLLKEALSEQRSENRKKLHHFLSDTGRFQQSANGWLFSLSASDLEWLLQVLNDVRVGSWISLGAPEPKLEIPNLQEQTIRDFWEMEMAGIFESALLEALDGQEDRVESRKAAAVRTLKCLGTGDGWPSADRNHAAFLYRFGSTHVLIDCGEGTSRSYKASGLSYDTIDAIFLSHMHADHMGGFFMFMQSLWLEKRRKELPVYLPASAIVPMKQMLETAMIYEDMLQFHLQMLPLKEGAPNTLKAVRVTPFSTSHLDSLRRKHPRAIAKASSCCFLLEHKNLRIGHSADLGKPQDLDPLFQKPLDLLVCELAHFTPKAILEYLKDKPVTRVVFVHLAQAYRKDLSAIRKLAQDIIPQVQLSFPQDGEELSL